MKDLNEIKDYWENKYPHVQMTLWNNEDQTRFFAMMSVAGKMQTVSGDTIGMLISEGEDFLRRAMMKP